MNVFIVVLKDVKKDNWLKDTNIPCGIMIKYAIINAIRFSEFL